MIRYNFRESIIQLPGTYTNLCKELRYDLLGIICTVKIEILILKAEIF